MIDFAYGGADYCFAESEREHCLPQLFDTNWLLEHELVQSQLASHGRGTVTFLRHPLAHLKDKQFVLKRYHRGGLVQRLSNDQYFWTGLKSTRAWREFFLLHRLHSQGLPCPKPYACQVEKLGRLYRAGLITEMIPGTETLAERLIVQGLDSGQWNAVGRCVQQFHQAHFCHADLNADNILLDRCDRVYLIDFDKGSIKKPARAWQFSNLKRLQRSLMKYWMEAESFCFGPADWEHLRQGYLLASESSGKNSDNADT